MVKRQWFFDKAAPIPGVSTLKKKKTLQSTKLRAFKNIQRMYELYNKKQLKAFFGLGLQQKEISNNKNWAAILLLESMYQSNFRKRAFTQNSKQRNRLAYSQLTIVNGSFVKNLCYVNKSGDQTLTKNPCAALNTLQSFYASSVIRANVNNQQRIKL